MDAESKKRTKVAVAKNRQQKTNKPPDSQKKGKGKFEYQNISKTRAKVGLYIKICPKLTDSGWDHSAVEDNT